MTDADRRGWGYTPQERGLYRPRGARDLPVHLANRDAGTALGDASAGEIVASFVVGIVTVLFVLRLGAAVYRRGIVRTGRRLRLGEVLRTS
ncbi:MAG TPA: hypothetical protein VGN51_03820 [Acidimicrobiia bacterium]